MTKKDDASVLSPTPADINVGQDVVTSDDLAKQEERKVDDESRSQRLGSDAVELRTCLQKHMFAIIIVAIVVFYVVFLLTAVNLIWSHAPFTNGFPITGVILVGMLGSIPTLLSLFLMNGLFNGKDAHKDKDEKSTMPDVTVTAKILTEFLKHVK